MAETKPVWAEAMRPTLSPYWMEDGNAFALLGHADHAQRRAGWTQEQQDAWRTEATSGDYDALLRCIVRDHDLPDDDEN